MDISFNKTYAVFRTPFSETEDLVQAFSGIRGGGVNDQDPVDYFYAALIRKPCKDIWHADQVLALSTDEAPPQVILGQDIGGNHALECAVAVNTSSPELSVRDIGTVWRDERGLQWTCVRVPNQNRGLFVSENLGASETDYVFAEKISGSLRREEGTLLPVCSQESRVPMASSIRHLEREVFALRKDQWIRADQGMTGCGQAQIREVYEIINPVSAVRMLRDGRPAKGYSQEQKLAMGDAMLRAELNYVIYSNGTIVTDFEYRAMQPIRWQGFLGLMYQEKCRPLSGSVKRYIPGLKPFRNAGRSFDFSRPYDLSNPFPSSFPASPEFWTDPDFPPDRQIEQIFFRRSRPCISFAAGILPVDDGEPEIRRNQVEDALRIVSSRKSYLTFCGASAPDECQGKKERSFSRVKGSVYRIYYPSDRHTSLYAIPHGGKLWLYADWIRHGKRERKSLSFSVPKGYEAVLHHGSGDIEWNREKDRLNMSGTQGYGVWVLSSSGSSAHGMGAQVAKRDGP